MLRSSFGKKSNVSRRNLKTSDQESSIMHVSNREMCFNSANEVAMLGREQYPDDRFMTSSSVTSSNWSQIGEFGDLGQFDNLSNASPNGVYSDQSSARQNQLAENMKTDNSPITDDVIWRKSPSSCKSDESLLGARDAEDVSEALCFSSISHCPSNTPLQQNHSVQMANLCQGCDIPIEDKYLLHIGGLSWHESCAKCAICRRKLQRSCYFSDGQLFCKHDYQQTKRTCSGCGSKIEKEELVMRVMTSGYVYHVGCFACVTCKRLLRKGDEFVMNRYVLDEKSVTPSMSFTLQCKACWTDINSSMKSEPECPAVKPEAPIVEPKVIDTPALVSPGVGSDVTDAMMSPKSPSCVLSPKSDDDDALSSDDDESTSGNLNSSKDDPMEDGKRPRENDDSDSKDSKRSKRPRTILNAVQRRAFKAAFEVTPKPCRKVSLIFICYFRRFRETLAKDTGLTVRVVQVWFQNQRAKMKKLAKRQLSQEAAAQKAREEFGYHAFDPMGPIPHQMSHMIPGSEGMMEKMFVQFHPHQMHGHVNGNRMGAPWDQLQSDMIGFGQGQLYHDGANYPDNMGIPPNVTMTPQDNGMLPHAMRNHLMTSQPPFGDGGGYQGNVHTHEGMHSSDMHVTSSHNGMTPSPGNDGTTPIDGLYSMQNSYFSS
uniref:Uncharacterized protein n=1 Tax=Ciona savignyi TaxID=51511 RepID=H2Y8I0_CIOSA